MTTGGIDAGDNKITNVEAGTDDTDAVNVSQLESQDSDLTTKGLDFAGNEGGDVHRDLGETLSITGGANATGDYSSDNLKTVTDPTTGAIELQLAESPKFGDVTVNEDDSGRISGVADGEKADDAVNLGQLEDVDATANAGWNVATSDTTATDTSNVAPDATVDFVSADDSVVVEHSRDNATGDTSIDFALGNDLTVGGESDPGKIVIKGKDDKDGVAIDGEDGSIGLAGPAGADGTDGLTKITMQDGQPGVDGQGGTTRIVYTDPDGNDQEVANLEDGLKFAGNTGDTIAKQLNEMLTVSGELDGVDDASGANLRVDSDGNQLNLLMARNLTDLDSATFGESSGNDQLVISQDGVRFVDVDGGQRDGTPSMTTDGIDGGDNKITGVADGDVSSDSTDAVNGSQLHKIDQVANAGWDVADTSGNSHNIGPGGKVTFEGDSNIGVTESGSNDNANVEIALNDSITLGEDENAVTVDGKNGKVSVGDTTMDGDGLTIAGGPSVTTGGIDAGGMQVTNVSSGLGGQSLDQISGDDLMNAANVGDLQKVAGDIGDDVAAAKTEVTEGKNISITKTTGDDGNDSYEVATSDEVDFDKMEVGSVTIDKDNVDGDGNTIIAGVGKGEVSEDSTDAVNGSQLHGVKEDIGDINSSLDTGMDFAADEGDAVNRKMGDTVAITGDDNITTRTNDDGVEVGLNRDLDVDSVTTGRTTVSNEGMTIEDGPSMTVDGIDAGGKRVTNVASGEAPTDAVNVGQMQELNKRFQQQLGGLSRRVEDVHDEANAGTASALAAASVPQATIPGKSMVSAGAGTYSGESAVSVGVSRQSDNGRWTVKLNATGDTQDNFGAGIGVGFHW